MCGICGEIRFDERAPAAGIVQTMTDVLAPRGPDGTGLFSMGRVALGQRRLKIIDLSEQSQQPMIDSALGLGVVYNGAIYNYQELRGELESRGYRFFSQGDTEVLIKGYHAWGEAFVERLAGMFAFALWERDTGRVVLGRDRLGIKPLYYSEVPGGLRFASTLPALAATPGVNTDIDPVALHYYMTFHAVVPAPFTLLQGVRKLPPATVMTVEADGTWRHRVYWNPPFGSGADEETLSLADWQDEVMTGLRRAVKRRLVADVPVGVLLSGGLDSSLIVGLLAEAGQHGLNTFSVGFESVSGEQGDEFAYSDIVARRFDTDHHKIFVSSERLLAALPECVRAMSEPMVSHDAVGFYLLSEEVARHVKVVQSGQGADEVFGGYHWYPPMLESQDPVVDYSHVFFDRDHDEFLRAVHPRFAAEDFSRLFVENHFAQPGAQRPVDKALRIDTQIMLVDDPVKRVDNMTMAWGLEARVPFLDHELVETAARIPAELKVRGGGKHVLKEAARKVIPPQVIDRPKGYFPVPALKYLQGDYLALVHDLLTGSAARQRDVFRPEYVEGLLADPERHITPLRGSKLWQVALLEYWLQLHNL